jgi:hypothetical protein
MPFDSGIMILTAFATTIVLAVLFCIAAAEFFVGQPFFEAHRQTIAISLGGTGITFLVLGISLARRRKTSGDDRRRLFVILDFRYWGTMFVLFGGLTLFVHSLGVEGLIQQARGLLSRTNQITAISPIARTNAPAPAPAVLAPTSFPSVKVQGIIFTKNRPMAILNGNSYGIGDRVGDAFVKSIQTDGVTLEKGNAVKTLLLGSTQARAL